MDGVQFKIIRTNGWSVSNKKKLALIHAAFFLLFPGFFFYQTLLGLGAIDAFLGGYFSVVSIGLFLPLMFFYVLDVDRINKFFSTTDFYFFLFVFYFFLIVVINYFSGSSSELVVDHLSSIVHMINLFIIFKALDFRDKAFRVSTILSLCGMSAIVFYFSIGGFFDLKDDALKNAELVATYQGFARSYLLTFVVAVAFYPSALVRILMYALGAATLFTNGARSEFVALVALIPLIELYYARRKLAGVVAIACVLLLVGLMFDDIVKALPENRILELIDLSKSSSANTRHYLTERALKTISRSPLLGEYGSYTPGGYAHNVLSAWVDLGLVGFTLLVAILIGPAIQLLLPGYFSKRKSSEFLSAASLIFITILLLITSHYFTDMLIGASLGAFARYRYGKTARREEVRSIAFMLRQNERAVS